jgi:hypothetical protein
MPVDLIRPAGIEQALPQIAAPKYRSIAVVELITTAALALSTAVAVTAVSIGIARADVFDAVTSGDRTPFALALFIGLLLSGMGGLTALMAADRTRHD